ncbi:MAG: hypothetical protein HY913_03015 [Desulfomonile tiedjei]|nr:hypothetical protein [Desulfomonile tiedjei]
MKSTLSIMALLWLSVITFPAHGALLEFADSCEDAHMKLEELVKNPEHDEIDKIMEALGVDLLASCDVPKGTMTCFQCLDKTKKLRSIQIFQDADSRKFTLKGYGCECTDQK